MAKLNQILAIEKGSKADGYKVLSDLNKIVQRQELFNGFNKVYSKIDEEGEELPPESKRVQYTVSQIITMLIESQSDSWHNTARKEWSNCTAFADISVNGTTLAERVPVTFLLQLEKHLTDLRTFIGNFPTLDASDDWNFDVNTALYKTDPVQTGRTKKVARPIVLYDATTEHPAQTQLISEDILAGYWRSTKQSGALPMPQKEKYLKNVDALLRAVKEARESANNTDEVETPHLERSLLNFIFND
jgi:hypothetical protein